MTWYESDRAAQSNKRGWRKIGVSLATVEVGVRCDEWEGGRGVVRVGGGGR